MKKIKSSTLIVDNEYYYALYSDKETKIKAKLLSRPSCQIGLMEKHDKFVFEHEDGTTIDFIKNNGTPGFLITYVDGKKQNSKVIDRVVFYNYDGEDS